MQSTHQRPWCVLSTQQLSCCIDPFCKILQACVIICYFSQVQQKFRRSQENWNKELDHGQRLYGCCFSVDLCILCPGILVRDLLAPLKRIFHWTSAHSKWYYSKRWITFKMSMKFSGVGLTVREYFFEELLNNGQEEWVRAWDLISGWSDSNSGCATYWVYDLVQPPRLLKTLFVFCKMEMTGVRRRNF